MELLKTYAPKIGGFIVVVALAIGWKFYNRSQDHGETLAELEALCEGEKECLDALAAHFDSCHEEAYRMGGRRQASHLDAAALVRCINGKSGQDLFAAE